MIILIAENINIIYFIKFNYIFYVITMYNNLYD